MHVVALTRWGRPMDAELVELAGWLHLTAYDLRLRLAGVLPAVFQVVPDAASAHSLVTALRARGHGAVSIDAREVGGDDGPVLPRDFVLGPQVLSGVDAIGQPFEVPYAGMLALLRATQVSGTERTTTSREKKLDLGRAVLSGGMVARKTVDKSAKQESERREQVLYVFERDRSAPYLLRAESLRYEGLGAELGVSSVQNFETLVAQLRTRAPRALYDDRLMTHKRKAGISGVAGQPTDRVVTTSNSSENDVAAALIVRAFLESQL